LLVRRVPSSLDIFASPLLFLQLSMAARERYDAIPGFSLVAPTTWEYVSTLPSGMQTWGQAIDAPSIIIVFPWTGAQGRHVAKYTMTYQALFPSTPILVITTSLKDMTVRSSKRKQERLRPAIERLLSYHDDSNVLVHAFSEGGSNKAVEFAEVYHSITGTRLQCTSLCLDSALGIPRYLRMCNALRKSLPPNPVLRGVGIIFGSAFLAMLWTLYCCFIGFSNNCISRTRGRIVDPQFWNPSTPRCFLYSEADELVDARDIQTHVEDSMALGIPVMDVQFEGSHHCKHAAQDPERYWNAVMTNWRSWTPERPKGELFAGETLEVPKKAYLGKSWSDSGSERTLCEGEMREIAY
jgi:hypothetical protein